MSERRREAGTSARVLLNEVRADLEREDREAIRSAKFWIFVRLCAILAVIVYVTWIAGPLSRTTPEELTRVAAAKLEQRLPEARSRLRDYALREASAETQRARELLVDVPTQLRRGVESRLLETTDDLVRRFEAEIGAWLEGADVRFGSPAGGEPQLSISLPPTGAARVGDWYRKASGRAGTLSGRIARLERGEGLSEAELLDKRLIEAWIALIQRGLEPPQDGRLEQVRHAF